MELFLAHLIMAHKSGQKLYACTIEWFSYFTRWHKIIFLDFANSAINNIITWYAVYGRILFNGSHI